MASVLISVPKSVFHVEECTPALSSWGCPLTPTSYSQRCLKAPKTLSYLAQNCWEVRITGFPGWQRGGPWVSTVEMLLPVTASVLQVAIPEQLRDERPVPWADSLFSWQDLRNKDQGKFTAVSVACAWISLSLTLGVARSYLEGLVSALKCRREPLICTWQILVNLPHRPDPWKQEKHGKDDDSKDKTAVFWAWSQNKESVQILKIKSPVPMRTIWIIISTLKTGKRGKSH